MPSATLPPATSAESDASAGRCGATRGCLKTHPSGLSVRNAPCRSRKRALPPGAHQCQARPCRLRPVRKATRRPGAAGRRGAVAPGQCVQGRPAPPKARATHKLHKFPGVAPQPMAVARACWADGRPARRPRGVQGARHPPERAAASPPGARTARRPPQAASCARARAVGIFYRGDKKSTKSKQRATWRPRDRGQSPRAMQWAWPHSACTSRSYSSCLGCRVRGPRRIVRSMQGSLA